MSKLTIYFKNNVQRSYAMEIEQTLHIGRDETNDLAINSPLFAPAHAVIIKQADKCQVKQLNEAFPLIINGKKMESANLNHGDTITVGEYDIVYNTNLSNHHDTVTNEKATTKIKKSKYIAHISNYQVINGTDIGKIFTLKTPMMLLGESGSGIVIITKRRDGFFVSILERPELITLNQKSLDNKTIKLNHNDVLALGSMTVQFYLQ